MTAKDDGVAIEVRARLAERLPTTSVFSTIEAASTFFEGGSVGYSVTSDQGRLDGIRLKTRSWKVKALEVEHVRSTWFADEARFPNGSVTFDCGLLMRDIPHEWQSEPDLYV